jgi:hypothetical protein
LSLGPGVGRVHDEQDYVGLGDLLERGAERRHELVRELVDKADRVAEQGRASARQLDPAHRRVEGGEKLVRSQDVGPCDPVEQAALAGVGVARQRHDGRLVAPAPVAVLQPVAAHRLQLLAQQGHALAGEAAVQLELRLARPPDADASPAAAGLPLEVRPHARQPWQKVLVLRELDLQLPLPGAGVAREDLQDQGRAVDDGHVEPFFQGALLGRRDLVVDDEHLGARGRERVCDLVHLAETHVGGGVGGLALLRGAARRYDACRRRELCQLLEGVGRAPWPVSRVDSKEERPLLGRSG